MTVWAAEEPLGSYSDNFVVATNSPLNAQNHNISYVPVGNGQCVDFIKAHGFEAFKGNAWEWAKYVNSDIGWPGYAVLLDEGPYQHLALVIDIN